jgi:antitoxin CptB
MTETADRRLHRLKIRCWRRGTKEMDLLLGPYADALLTGETAADLDAFEALIAEADSDLYRWISGADAAPEGHRPALDALRRFHGIVAA